MVANREYLKSAGGLYYALDPPGIVSPLNSTLVVCIGGSGEFGSYTAPDMQSEIDRVVNKNGFAQDVSQGIKLPFWVLSPLATKSTTDNMASHSLIMREISNLAKIHKQDYAFLGGLSLGGQTSTGMALQCRNSTEINKGQESQYKNPTVWDGFFLISGKVPGTPQPCAMPEVPVIIFGNTGDTAVPIQNQIRTMDVFNSCSMRTEKILPNKVRKTVGGIVTWPDSPIPEDHLNRLIITLGGGHGTSWNLMYDWYAKTGPGFEFNQWVNRVAKPIYKPIDCPATLDEKNMVATFHMTTGDKVYRLSEY
jgi:hypothetical protein